MDTHDSLQLCIQMLFFFFKVCSHQMCNKTSVRFSVPLLFQHVTISSTLSQFSEWLETTLRKFRDPYLILGMISIQARL